MKEQILKLREEGKTYSQIVKTLGCALSTVSYHCGNKTDTSEWKTHDYSIEELKQAVKDSISIRQLSKKLNVGINGSTYNTLKNKFIEHNIDVSHFKGQSWADGIEGKLTLTKEEFIKTYLKVLKKKPHTHTLKLRLYKYGIKEEKCEKCGLGNEWKGNPISLHLDHINGNNKDNRLENLNILCPNCHSQTDTYAGKNIGKN